MKKRPTTKPATRPFAFDSLSARFFTDWFGCVQDFHGKAMIAKGFHDTPRSPLETIALMHTELAELTEGYRHGNGPDDKIPAFSCAEAECADLILRVMDFAHSEKLRLAQAIIAKIEHNATRPYKHGKTC